MREEADTAESTGGLAPDTQRRAVRRRYARIATEESSCCASSSCGDDADRDELNKQLGYSEEADESVAAGANLGLGCGNPNALAALQSGETVLDLGSGAGFDCFLAAQEVGETGHVVGVDMTPEMVEKARENVAKNDAHNVEFRLGEIEHLPVADETVDVIISNCVLNLSPDKQRVFDDAYRVLRPGGRLAISDVVLTARLPSDVHADPESVASCVAGASPISDLETMLSTAGFEQVAIEPKEASEQFIREWDDERDVSDYVVSATIEGRKPEQ
jgi:arsenite methyltransferase